MRVLWLCNIVLPELSDEFGFKKQNAGGWLTGAWNSLKELNDIQMGICVPIKDSARMKDGEYEGYKYYSFHIETGHEVSEVQIECFKHIINDYKPDVIHIWGTEYLHSLSMVKACKELGILNKIVLNIQGLVSVCASVYNIGLPEEIKNSLTVKNAHDSFYENGKNEIEVIKNVKNVMGRTNWDKACVKLLNPEVNYIFCGEILRNCFYDKKNQWNVSNCEKYSIFMSQAGYPIKGLHLIIDELKKLYKSCPQLKVYIGGANPVKNENDYGKYIQKLISDSGLTDVINFVGNLNESEMIEYYLKSNVFLCPSLIENSSNSICEAMMLGVPVVASYVGGTPSIIKNCENGFTFALNEPYMMRYYLDELFRNSAFQKKISKAEIKFSHTYNNRRKISNTIYRVYKQISK